MKAISSKAALVVLLIGTAGTTVQADPWQWVWPEDRPQLMIAEGGSDRVMDYHQQLQRSLVEQRSRMDSGERYVQMIKEQPTAVGNMTGEQSEMSPRSTHMYKPPIQRDRELYGK